MNVNFINGLAFNRGFVRLVLLLGTISMLTSIYVKKYSKNSNFLSVFTRIIKLKVSLS